MQSTVCSNDADCVDCKFFKVFDERNNSPTNWWATVDAIPLISVYHLRIQPSDSTRGDQWTNQWNEQKQPNLYPQILKYSFINYVCIMKKQMMRFELKLPLAEKGGRKPKGDSLPLLRVQSSLVDLKWLDMRNQFYPVGSGRLGCQQQLCPHPMFQFF